MTAMTCPDAARHLIDSLGLTPSELEGQSLEPSRLKLVWVAALDMLEPLTAEELADFVLSAQVEPSDWVDIAPINLGPGIEPVEAFRFMANVMLVGSVISILAGISAPTIS